MGQRYFETGYVVVVRFGYNGIRGVLFVMVGLKFAFCRSGGLCWFSARNSNVCILSTAIFVQEERKHTWVL